MPEDVTLDVDWPGGLQSSLFYTSADLLMISQPKHMSGSIENDSAQVKIYCENYNKRPTLVSPSN